MLKPFTQIIPGEVFQHYDAFGKCTSQIFLYNRNEPNIKTVDTQSGEEIEIDDKDYTPFIPKMEQPKIEPPKEKESILFRVKLDDEINP